MIYVSNKRTVFHASFTLFIAVKDG